MLRSQDAAGSSGSPIIGEREGEVKTLTFSFHLYLRVNLVVFYFSI